MNERIAALAREAGLSITDFYDTKLCAGRPEHIEALVKLVASDIISIVPGGSNVDPLWV